MAKQFDYQYISLSDKDSMSKLKQMGKEGWELVAPVVYSPVNGRVVTDGILKKEISPEIHQEQKQSSDNKYSWER